MPHRSFPPSVLNPPRVPAASLLRVVSTGQASALPAQPNRRVRVFPSADGTILLVGVTLAGAWVAEYRCLAPDFDERCVLAMERRVRIKERQGIRVIP